MRVHSTLDGGSHWRLTTTAVAAAAKRRTEEMVIFMLIDLVVVSGGGLAEVLKLEIVDVDVDLSVGCCLVG